MLWIVTAPAINAVLTFCAEKIVFVLDTYDITKAIDSAGKNIILRYAPSPDGKPLILNYRNLTFNTVFLLALIMAVPSVPPRTRFKIILLGMCLLFPVQICRLVVIVFNHYGQHIQMAGKDLYPVVLRKGLYQAERLFARLDGQLVPVVIWSGLYFYYVWYHKYFRKRVGIATH